MKCLAVLLTLLVHRAIGANSLETAIKDNLCLNGSYDSEGKCECNAGYAMYRGRCFLVNSSAIHTASEDPARSDRSCTTGYNDDQCCSGTLCDSSCPPGYVLNRGFCEIQNPTCPPGTYFNNGFCYFQPIPPHAQTAPPIETIKVVEPVRVNIPVPELVEPLDSNEFQPNEDDDEDIEVVPDRRPHPGKNIVHNVNTVNSPTNVTSHNINNVFIHITRHKSDGSIKAVVIRNNETTVYEEKPSTIQESEKLKVELVTTEQPQKEKCCIIVSPRICRKQQDEWACFHRKHYRCGTFCTSNVLYLKPRRPMLRNSSLIMPPTMNFDSRMQFGLCRWGVCPSIDCSGCLRGSYRCHVQCYTYDCARQGGCNFVNQDDYCDDKEDELCTLDE
ncbi:uncharacterized protein LOC135702288 [Ochlerotatus camptorhynchus]|uniref:uncharacterized protein LOC135702288 n=1 Tax=Ochlerotatus camptorhynchus TaxID=644619 RepID=UPI0031E1266C